MTRYATLNIYQTISLYPRVTINKLNLIIDPTDFDQFSDFFDCLLKDIDYPIISTFKRKLLETIPDLNNFHHLYGTFGIFQEPWKVIIDFGSITDEMIL